MPIIKETPVESSNIATVGFSKETLQIRFKAKKDKPEKIYHYFPVRHETFLEMLASDSKGKFLNENIKKNDEIDYKEVKQE